MGRHHPARCPSPSKYGLTPPAPWGLSLRPRGGAAPAQSSLPGGLSGDRTPRVAQGRLAASSEATLIPGLQKQLHPGWEHAGRHEVMTRDKPPGPALAWDLWPPGPKLSLP